MDNLFSIIVPIYNSEGYLRDCIDSILSQTFTEFELLLIDDGSTDGSAVICDEYASKDQRIKVIHKQNGGQSSARNAGIRQADGEYFIFIDSDDSLNDDYALEKFAALIKESSAPDIIISKTWNGNPDIPQNGDALLEFLVKSGFREKTFCTAIWDKIYKQSLIKSNNLMFKEGYVHEDILWLFMVLHNVSSFVVTDIDFYVHNVVENSTIRDMTDKAVLRRAVSKLNITLLGVQYFQLCNRSVRYAANEFYIGIYINGLAEGLKIKKNADVQTFLNEIKKTALIFRYGIHTHNKKYKVLSLVYAVAGYKGIIKFIQRKYR